MKFSEQAPIFLEQLATRKRRPVKPATLRAYKGYINNWILPKIGHRDLQDFNNGAMKRFVEELKDLKPISIIEIVNTVKLIIRSVVTEDGEYVYPREWNNDFIDLPLLGKQHQPILSLLHLKAAIRLEQPYGTLAALLAGTGLRIGEARALRFGDDGVHTAWNPDKAYIAVRTAMYQNQEQSPKTLQGVRMVELHPYLNRQLSNIVEPPAVVAAGQFMFPMSETQMRNKMLKALGISGFHSFRRFRVTHLRAERVPEDIIRFWIGHANAEGGLFEGARLSHMTDRYSKLALDAPLRAKWAYDAGLGFDFPHATGHEAPKDGEDIPVWVSGFKE